ncbi:hypothetical protein [Komagataeibacter xylinus]|uniref:hypothetical protein n=1 Tax=Komagataeibacter xylinus TaxID=28448 RepID=UPI00280A6F26|nr:hypothetical protein [Komagataeibacter xylinus]
MVAGKSALKSCKQLIKNNKSFGMPPFFKKAAFGNKGGPKTSLCVHDAEQARFSGSRGGKVD